MTDLRTLPIIMCSMSRWDGDLSSAAFSIAKELSKTNKIFYIDYPYTIKDFITERKDSSLAHRREAVLKGKDIYTRVPGLSENFIAVTPPMMLSLNFLPDGVLYNKLNRINNKRFFSTVQRILDDHGIDRFIFFNSFNPFYGVRLENHIKPEVFIYQSRDDIRAFQEGVRHGVAGERVALKNADVILATSTNLKKVLEKDGGREVHLLPNAAQNDLFKETLTKKFDRPEELAGNDKPVVGYIGHIGLRNDFQLFAKMVKAHPDKLFLMVGPRNEQGHTDINLDEMPNVIFTGPKPLEELPRYLQYMDCTLIPFLKNELTKSIYPLKLNEQLAAGRAVVTTNFSVDLERFKDVVYISDSHEEFIENIDKAVQANSPEEMAKRVRSSEGNSWEDRINLLWQIIENYKTSSLEMRQVL